MSDTPEATARKATEKNALDLNATTQPDTNQPVKVSKFRGTPDC